MTPFECKICGSRKIIKSGGEFICQYCGTKYSENEFRDLIAASALKRGNDGDPSDNPSITLESKKPNVERKINDYESAIDQRNDNIKPMNYQREMKSYSSQGSKGHGVLVVILCALFGLCATLIFVTRTSSSNDSTISNNYNQVPASTQQTVTYSEPQTAYSSYSSTQPNYQIQQSYSETQPEEMANDLSEAYLIPGSDSRYINYSDLFGFDDWECKLARNEIYARHGRRFNNADIQYYFDSQSWYHGTIDPEQFNEGILSAVERENVKIIKEYEKQNGFN